MNFTLGVSAIQKPYTKCNHLLSSVASLAVFESDGNASKNVVPVLFFCTTAMSTLFSYNSFTLYTPYTNIETNGSNQNVPLLDKNRKIFLGRTHN